MSELKNKLKKIVDLRSVIQKTVLNKIKEMDKKVLESKKQVGN